MKLELIRNINDLTNLLRDLRSRYQASWVDADETRKKELEELRRNFISGTPLYRQKQEEIEYNFNSAVMEAQRKASEMASQAFEDLRTRELMKLEKIDKEALSEINALQNLSLSEIELKQLVKKFGSNAWIQKKLSQLAEENGISTKNLGLDTPIDVKLNVIRDLEKQLDKLLRDYHRTAATIEAKNARFLWLADNVLQHAIDIYTNGVVKTKELDAVTMASLKIKAKETQVGKATLISNSLKNIKTEDARNAFLYKLAQDNSIASEAFALSGINDEMLAWKHGKSERYIKCSKLIEKIKTEQDSGKIIDVFRNYLDRVSTGTEVQNEFLPAQIERLRSENKVVVEALANAGFTYAEKQTLLGDSANFESIPISEQTEK